MHAQTQAYPHFVDPSWINAPSGPAALAEVIDIKPPKKKRAKRVRMFNVEQRLVPSTLQRWWAQLSGIAFKGDEWEIDSDFDRLAEARSYCELCWHDWGRSASFFVYGIEYRVKRTDTVVR